MIEFFKGLYESLKNDLVYYLGIDGKIFQNIFTSLFLLLLLLAFLFIIKNLLQYFKLLKRSKDRKRKIDKMIINTMQDSSKKRKQEKNI